jgi:hypothetical protein
VSAHGLHGNIKADAFKSHKCFAHGILRTGSIMTLSQRLLRRPWRWMTV